MKTDIYPNTWRVTGIILLSLLFGALMHYTPLIVTREFSIIIRILFKVCIVFCVLACIFAFAYLIMKASGIPLATIYDDRFVFLVPIKLKYQTIMYDDVEQFFMFDINSAKILRAVTFEGKQIDAGLTNSQVSHLSDICGMLNAKLAEYHGWNSEIEAAR